MARGSRNLIETAGLSSTWGIYSERMRRFSLVLLVLFAVLFADRAALAKESDPPLKSSLVVGTKASPPFAIKNPDGSWTGLAIELWRMIAVDLGVKFEIREYDLKSLLAAVEKGEVDVGVGALTITAEREKAMDFCHPIY